MKKKIIFIIIISMIFMLNVKAESSFSCNKEVEEGKNITCNINIDSSPAYIESDKNIKIVSFTGDDYRKSSEFKATFYKSGTITFGPVESKYLKYTFYLSSEDNNSLIDQFDVNIIKKTTTTTTTKKKSNNNYLSKLLIDDEELEEFEKSKTKYYTSVESDITKVVITAKKEDENAVVKVDGPKVLEYGDNEYTISVTAEDETVKYYKIIITRKNEESSNTKISKLKVKGYKLNFDGKSKTYHLKINENTSKLNLEVKLEDDKSSYEIIDNDNLKNGSIVKIKVTAEDNSFSTYRLIIEKDVKKNIIPYVVGGGLLFFIIVIVIIILIIKNKKSKGNNISSNNKIEKVKNDHTIKIDLKKDEEQTNLEEESYEVDNDLEKTKTLVLNNDLEKTIVADLDKLDNNDD